MRFDYQPALVNVTILKTSKQKKLFWLFSTVILGCLIILSSIARTFGVNKKIDHNSYANPNNSNLMQSAQPSQDDLTKFNETKVSPSSKNQSINFKDLKSTLKVMQPSSSMAKLEVDANLTLSHEKTKLALELPKVKRSINDLGSNEVAWQTIKINHGDTLSSILQGILMPGVYIKDFNNFIKTNQLCKTTVSSIKDGHTIKVLLDSDRNLQTMQLALAPHKTLFIDRVGPKNYKAYYEEKPIIKRLVLVESKIGSSFYAAAQSIGLNDHLIMEMAEIFGWDIDFSLDLRPNDKFKILYEEKFIDQEKIGTGNIVVAEFINQGRKYQAIRFTDHYGKSSYYTPEGYSMNKTFLRTPVKFTRIGSKFSASRRHPILHRLRAHKGVDYVAPSGTPVKAAGDGKVLLVGKKGGYGNVVELLHGNKYSTLYAHLSKFACGLKKDQLVKQGQVIGYVGRTGLATGDHLHYEFRVDGVHRDPLTVQFPRSMPLASNHRVKFLSHAQKMVNLLDENNKEPLKFS